MRMTGHTMTPVGSSSSASSFLIKIWPNITLLRESMMETTFAVAIEFSFPSSGSRDGMAIKAIFAANKTAACDVNMLVKSAFLNVE